MRVETPPSVSPLKGKMLTCREKYPQAEWTQIQDQELSTRSRTGPPAWGRRSIPPRKNSRLDLQQAPENPEKLVHYAQCQWQGMEAVSVYQKTLARLRENRDRSHYVFYCEHMSAAKPRVLTILKWPVHIHPRFLVEIVVKNRHVLQEDRNQLN